MANAVGSSPRVRGTGLSKVIKSTDFRFIPACAGNSNMQREGADYRTVHPRVCGEQFVHIFDVGTVGGSSPRVRGTGACLLFCPAFWRFIPACAGNSYL